MGKDRLLMALGWVAMFLVLVLCVLLFPSGERAAADCRAGGGDPVWQGNGWTRVYRGCAEGRR